MLVSQFRPWRSVWLPRIIAAVVLLAGVPLYLRAPLWCDLTLYDIAARNLLEGGIHYRDVFDTNLPGFVWLLTGIRWVFGFGPFTLRCVDLAIVTGIVLLIDRLAKRGGATPAARWWVFAAIALLYPCAVEMVHCQRDTWMALPVLVAMLLRLRRAGTPSARPFADAALEGVLWGMAVWIKPHVVLIAAGVWLVTVRRIADPSPRLRAGIVTDLLGNLVGGLVVGLAGVAYLVGSGTWPHFWEVMHDWAPAYNALSWKELPARVGLALHWFPPWSLWLLPTVPLALLSILDAVPWSSRAAADQPGPVGRRLPGWLWDREAGPDARFVRAALAALYLVWAFQALVVQRGFAYAHMPETLLMFGLWAAHRWTMPALVILWIAVTSTVWLVADASPAFRDRLLTVATDRHISAAPGDERYLVRSPLADRNRMRNWPDCWRMSMTSRERCILWDRLRRIDRHEAVIGWEELDEVADFLREQGVKDGQVLAWHDSPHALYLMLGIKPGTRYIHINTVQGIDHESYARVQQELADSAGTARFAVSDLEFPAGVVGSDERDAVLGPPRSIDDLLPLGLPPTFRASFPFNQKAVFRTRHNLGRYLVHELTPPFGDQPAP